MHPLLVRSFSLRVFVDATVEGLEAFKDLLVTECVPYGVVCAQAALRRVNR